MKKPVTCSDRHPLFNELDDELIRQGLKNCRSVQAGIQNNPDVAMQMAGLAKAATAYYYETRATMILSGAYVGYLPEHMQLAGLGKKVSCMLLPAERC